MELKKEETSQLSLREALSSLPVVPTYGMIGFGKNDMPEGEELDKAYDEAPNHISLEPYVYEWTRKRVSAIPRLGISYTGYSDGNRCWARPIVLDGTYRFLHRHEVDHSKLPPLEEFLHNPHFLHVQLSLATPDPLYGPDLEEFAQNQLAALFGLFDTIEEHGFHLDNGSLFKENSSGAIQYLLTYQADAQNGSTTLYLNDDSEPLEGRIKPEDATKLVNWFEAIQP